MSEVEFIKQEPQFAAFLAIDWADQKHVWCLQAVGSEKRESGEVKHSPETMEAWVGQLWSDRSGTGAIPGSCGLHAEKV